MYHIANFPPNITADAVFIVTVGQESAYIVTVVDPGDNFTLTVLGGLPPNSELESLEDGEYLFLWNLQEIITQPLVFIAIDSKGASSTFIPVVEVCACSNGGNCTREGLLSNNATVVLNCVCPQGIHIIYSVKSPQAPATLYFNWPILATNYTCMLIFVIISIYSLQWYFL